MLVDYYLLIKYTPDGRHYPRLDCWGLVCEFYKKELNIILDQHTDFNSDSMTEGMQKELRSSKFKEIDHPKNNAVVCFFRRGLLHHVGIWYNNKLLHATKRNGVIFSNIPYPDLKYSQRKFFVYEN